MDPFDKLREGLVDLADGTDKTDRMDGATFGNATTLGVAIR